MVQVGISVLFRRGILKKRYLGLAAGMVCFCGMLGSAGSVSAQAQSIPLRGVVEGFYGNPWSQQDRLDALQFMGKHGLNLYIYAPKDDPYHREKWRETYPPTEMQRIQKLLRTARANDVEFVFAISPGLDMRFSGVAGQQDLDRLIWKLNSLYDIGVRRFAIFFDDIQNKDALRQVAVLNAVNARFIHEKPDVRSLFTVPTEYFSEDMIEQGAVKPYTAAFAGHLDKDIEVMYTGPGVVCEGISEADISAVERIYGRKMSVWWNYPVTDYMRGKLALGPVCGLNAETAGHMAAFVMNPMEHEALSKITLATGADYARRPQSYDPEKSWQQSLHEEYGSLAASMEIFAGHAQRMNNDWAHTGRPDAPLMRAHMDALWKTLAEKQDPANAIRQLQQDFAATEQAAAKLQKGLPAKQQKEAASQLELLDQLAAGGQTALLMIQAQQAGRPVTAEAFYQKLCSLQAALPSPEQTAISDETAAAFLQEAIRWQDDQRGQAAAVPNS